MENKQKQNKQEIHPQLERLTLQLNNLDKLKDSINNNNQPLLNKNDIVASKINPSVDISVEQLELQINNILQIKSIDNLLTFFNSNYDQFKNHLEILSSFIQMLFFFKTQKAFLSLNTQTKLAAMGYFKDMISFYKNIAQLTNFLHFFDIYNEVKSYYFNSTKILSDKRVEVNSLLTIISLFQYQNIYNPQIIISKLLFPRTEMYIIDYLIIYKDSLIPLYDAILTKQYKLSPKTAKVIIESPNVKQNPQIKEELLCEYTQQNINSTDSLSEYILLVQEHYPKSQRINYHYLVNQAIQLYFKYDLINQVQVFILKIINKEVINIELITQLLFKIPYKNAIRISKLIQAFPSLFDLVVNDYIKSNEMSNLLKLIKALPKFELDSNIKKDLIAFSLNSYYSYKINESINDQFDLIADYALCNEEEYNIALNKIFERKRRNKCRKELKFFVINGLNKGYKFNMQNHLRIIKEYGNDYESYLQLNDQPLPKDIFSIRTIGQDCLVLPKEINVLFTTSINQISEFIQSYLVNSKYIGIDSEWKQTKNMFEKGRVSILQLSDVNGQNVLLIDMIKFDMDKDFVNALNLLSNTTFIGFSFSSDLVNFNMNTKEFFQKVHFEDLLDLYKNYSNKNECPGLSTICKEILGKSLCKYEQCSNWENRPLRQSQMHYAALDAVACVRLYKQLKAMKKDKLSI